MNRIVILALDYAVASTVTGPFDVFHQAGLLCNYVQGKKPKAVFDICIATADGLPVNCLGGVSIKPHKSIRDVGSTDLVIISSIANISKTLDKFPAVVGWLIDRYNAGAIIASVCTGAFLLAETGLLNHKTATTHWGFARLFRMRYPMVNLKPKRLITDEGDLFCSGGVNSGIDLSLYLVERFCGHEMAVQCAKAIVYDFNRHSQAAFSVTHFQKNHSDEKIASIQDYIEQNYTRKLNFDKIAMSFGLSRRSFHRRFKSATGDTPLTYLQRYRIERAKLLLESSQFTFSEISYKMGYEDSGFFRRLFAHHTGLRPSEYQKRFSSKMELE